MTAAGGAPVPPVSRLCFFGTYNRGYTVTRLLLQACRSAGIDVVECHRPLWEEARHKPAGYFAAASAIALLATYARHAVSLGRELRAHDPFPAYVVGFNGQFDCLLLRWLLRRHPAPIVFAPLVTLTETLVDDRDVFGARSLRARLAWRLDRASLAAATRVVIDTEAHRAYLLDTFGLPQERVVTWYLGADPTVFTPAPPPAPRSGAPVRVLFYGSFLPLHGVRTILAAAERLRGHTDIEFILAGGGPEHAACVEQCRRAGLALVTFRDWVPYESLGDLIAGADICLGIFGTSRKARMVIPNKAFQVAAVGRPLITADTPAVREVFTNGDTAWLCPPGDPEALAAAIRTLAADTAMRHRLGTAAAAMMAQRFSIDAQGRRLAALLAAAATTLPARTPAVG